MLCKSKDKTVPDVPHTPSSQWRQVSIGIFSSMTHRGRSKSKHISGLLNTPTNWIHGECQKENRSDNPSLKMMALFLERKTLWEGWGFNYNKNTKKNYKKNLNTIKKMLGATSGSLLMSIFFSQRLHQRLSHIPSSQLRKKSGVTCTQSPSTCDG